LIFAAASFIEINLLIITSISLYLDGVYIL